MCGREGGRSCCEWAGEVCVCGGGGGGGVAVSGWERYGGCGYEWDGSLVPRPCMFVT